MKLKYSYYEDEALEDMKTMYLSGSTMQVISDKYRISREYVRQKLAAIGITGKSPHKKKIAIKNKKQRQSLQKMKTALRVKKSWGFTLDEYNLHISIYGNKSDLNSPMSKFSNQRGSAKRRNIKWQFTFKQWFSAWVESGFYEKRGLGIDLYVMARKNDSGPYSKNNIYFCTGSKNVKDGWLNKPYASRKIPQNKKDAKGYFFNKNLTKNPYIVYCKKKYYGSFATAKEANEKYISVVNQNKCTNVQNKY